MAVVCGDFREVCFAMETGIIPDDGGVWAQLFAQHVFEPLIDQFGISGS
jgi:hypothetical protein